ncbi:MAG: phospho-sugar mutase [Oscillospiraceae bacterium]|nr:phospho-sugar mutase [Oscillospiraceae bacterium]
MTGAECMEVYLEWLNSPKFGDVTRAEPESIKGDEKEIEDRFYKDLEFGTGGMRGLIGAGTNRMNVHTVRRVTKGLADYMVGKDAGSPGKGVVIAYDSRRLSDAFSLEAALVLCECGIRAYLFDSLRPTPELSFAVRRLGAAAGVVVTASHNPKEYNGYKVYGDDGAQLSLEASEEVSRCIGAAGRYGDIRAMDRGEAEKAGLLTVVGPELDDAYMGMLKALRINPEVSEGAGGALGIAYTPLHGAGNVPVRRILRETGYAGVRVVASQEAPDPDFPTVATPNPEERSSFAEAVAMADKEGIDLIIATDPDCDRLGLAVRDLSGGFVTLTGNQTGCMLAEYILSSRRERGDMPAKPFIVKTMVTTEMARAIADRHGVGLVEVLTGFKFIGERIKEMDEDSDWSFLFGFEESYGYLAGTSVRDKDAVVTAMLVAEMAAHYAKRGMTVYEGLQGMYRSYGHFLEGVSSYSLKGREGSERIGRCMDALRARGLGPFGATGVAFGRDYLTGTVAHSDGRLEGTGLPSANALYYGTDAGGWLCVRPSGTEPKIKLYFGVSAPERADAEASLARLKSDVLSVVEPLLGL